MLALELKDVVEKNGRHQDQSVEIPDRHVKKVGSHVAPAPGNRREHIDIRHLVEIENGAVHRLPRIGIPGGSVGNHPSFGGRAALRGRGLSDRGQWRCEEQGDHDHPPSPSRSPPGRAHPRSSDSDRLDHALSPLIRFLPSLPLVATTEAIPVHHAPDQPVEVHRVLGEGKLFAGNQEFILCPRLEGNELIAQEPRGSDRCGAVDG